MTGQRPAQRPGSPRPLLAERLLAAIRPEFRGEVLVFAATDPVFGGGACRVAGCRRSARGHGMCQGHHLRWVSEARPDLELFAATTDPRWRRQRSNAACRVGRCGYGVARGGLCQLHHQRWERSGRPDLDTWLGDPPAIKQPQVGATCRIGHCQLWPRAAWPFCHAHANTWKANGRPDVEEFVAGFAVVPVTEDEIIRLDRLSPRLRMEVQFALQCRHDERTTKASPAVVMQVVRFLATTGAVSLLDQSEDAWRGQIGRPAPKDPNPRALLIFARRKIEDLADADGWEAEYPRDVWQLRRLGYGNQMLRFDAIPQRWLRELVKRWLRWRLGTGLGLEATRRGLRSLTRFARFCDGMASAPCPASTGRCWNATWLTCTPRWPAGSATATTSGS